jgi:hypothetical protein
MIFWCPLSPNTNDDRPAPGSADKLVHLARLYSQGLCIFGINASMAARRGSASLASSALRRPSTRIIMQNIHIGLYCHAGCLRSLSKGPQVLQRGFISVNGLSEKSEFKDWDEARRDRKDILVSTSRILSSQKTRVNSTSAIFACRSQAAVIRAAQTAWRCLSTTLQSPLIAMRRWIP